MVASTMGMATRRLGMAPPVGMAASLATLVRPAARPLIKRQTDLQPK